MEMRYRECDHCHKVLSEMGDFCDYLIDFPFVDYYSINLCRNCAKELKALVGKFVGRVTSLEGDIKDGDPATP